MMINNVIRLCLLLAFLFSYSLIADTIEKSFYFTKSNDSENTTFKAFPKDKIDLTLEYDITALKSKRNNIDVLFLIDNTGSMGTLIEAVKGNIEPIYQNVSKQFKSTRFAIATVADHKDTKDWELITDFTTKTSTLQENVRKIAVSAGRGNTDWDEDYLYGLHKAKQLLWRPDATKLIVLIGDAGYHDPDEGGDRKSGTADDLTSAKVFTELKAKEIIVSTIYCDGEAQSSMESISSTTGGVTYFYTSQVDNMVSKMDQLIHNIGKPTLRMEEEYSFWEVDNQYPKLLLSIPSDMPRDNRNISVNVMYLGQMVGTLDMNVILGEPWGLMIISGIVLLLLVVFVIEYIYSVYMLVSTMDIVGKLIHTSILLGGLIVYIGLMYGAWILFNERWFPLIWTGFWW